MEIRNDVGTSSVSKYFDIDSISPDVKRRKDALKQECRGEKAVSYRKIAHILGRLKQFDIFFLFVLSLPFVTVWLVYVSCKQFYEIFSTCCNEDELEKEQDEFAKAQQQEGEEEEEKEEGEEEEEEEEEEVENKETKEEVNEKEEEEEKKEKNEKIEKINEENEKIEKRVIAEEKAEKKKEEEEWTTVKKKKPDTKKNKGKVGKNKKIV